MKKLSAFPTILLPAILVLASIPTFASHAQSRVVSQFHVPARHAHHAAQAASQRQHPNQPAREAAALPNASRRTPTHRAHRSASRKTASVATVGFVSAVQIPAGGAPQGDQSSADVNGDGKQDIVSLVWNDTGSLVGYFISVALGNGDGTFQTPVLTAVKTNDPILVGDLDGDGKADALQVHPSGPSSADVWISDTNGDAKFTHAAQGATFSITDIGLQGGVLADLNADGKLDILAVDTANPGLVWTLLGNGDGTFQTGTSTALAGNSPDILAFADFDGDGKIDFAGLNYTTEQVDVYLQGASVFTQMGSDLITPDAVYDTCNLTAGDLTGDGKAEIVSTNCNDNNITVYVNAGDATFATGVYYGSGSAPGSTDANIDPQNVTIADVNGDSKADIIVSNYDGGDVTVLLGNGDGTVTVPSVGYAVGGYPSHPALVGDFNGDSLQDIIVNDDEFSYAFLQGYGDGTFRSGLNYYAAGDGDGVNVVSGDFNGDGNPDFALSNCCGSTGGIAVFLSRADGSLLPGVNYGAGGNLQSLVVADFNGDTKPDIAAADLVGQVVDIFTGVGDGTFTLGSTTYATDTKSSSPFGIVAGDFDHDGKIDLAVLNGNGLDVAVLIGAGDGTFSAPTTYALSQLGNDLVAADVNGDGYLDLIIPLDANPSNGIAILLGKTDNSGTFNAEADTAVGFNQTYSAAVGDFDGDGKVDLAFTVQDSSSEGMAVALGNGDGTFGTPALFPSTLQDPNLDRPVPTHIEAFDLDGDGKLDLILTNAEFGTVATLFGAGDGTFSAPAEYASGGYAYGLVLADVNGDGATDVVTAGDDFTGVTVLLNNSGSATQPNFGVTADTDTATVKAGSPATFNLTLVGKNGYTGTVTFACTGLPAGATCAFAPATIVANGDLPFSTVLTVTTAAKSGAAGRGPDSQTNGPAFWEELSGLGLFGMFLVGGTRKSRRQTGIILGVLVVAMVLALAGCGSSHAGTPIGSHAFAVTATGTGANAPTQTTMLTLVVQ